MGQHIVHQRKAVGLLDGLFVAPVAGLDICMHSITSKPLGRPKFHAMDRCYGSTLPHAIACPAVFDTRHHHGLAQSEAVGPWSQSSGSC